MTKVGTVTLTIEPHVIEATMYVVKESKLRQAQATSQQQQQSKQQQKSTPTQPQTPTPAQPPTRPILQYGPPNGVMPPPPTPTPALATDTTTTTTATPAIATVTPKSSFTAPNSSNNSPQSALVPTPKASVPPMEGLNRNPATPVAPLATNNTAPSSSPTPSNAPSYVSRPPAPTYAPPMATPPLNSPLGQPLTSAPLAKPTLPTAATRPPANAVSNQPHAVGKATVPASGQPATSAPKPAPNDPVIALLAQRASADPELRDLMKRVAVGQAKDGELAHFQKIIDQLNAEYRKGGGQQGPSADRLLVDGRTVKYFADEVRTILDIVLASNPQQKSSELRPPPRSDPLVVLLVKTALEDKRTKDMIRRIAENRPGFTDATDLKAILDRLHRDMKTVPQGIPTPVQPKHLTTNGVHNGHVRAPAPHTPQHPNPQSLRSKGPPPTPKPDISAVVVDFGSGDRYLFPKYSILEYLPTSSGQQVVASFLIVRKGSTSEYGGDPKLDYYQPATIRLSTPTGRHLENLARVVAPQDEVRRYMDDVMDNMTRAEYVLLAMRLPRFPDVGEMDISLDEPKVKKSGSKDNKLVKASQPSVLWTTKLSKSSKAAESNDMPCPEDENEAQYRRLIESVADKDSSTV